MAVILLSAPALPSTVIVTMTPRVLLIVLAAPTGSVAVALAVPVAVPVPLSVPVAVPLPLPVPVPLACAIVRIAVTTATPRSRADSQTDRASMWGQSEGAERFSPRSWRGPTDTDGGPPKT